MSLTREQRGFSLVELSAAMAIIAILALIALPVFTGMRNQARDTEAISELRAVLQPMQAYHLDGDATLTLEEGVKGFSPSVKLDGTAVAGVKLEAAADGATCAWRVSHSGTVFGLWYSPSGQITLYAELASLPASCPTGANAASAGFVSDPW